jgi:hypothetical protein
MTATLFDPAIAPAATATPPVVLGLDLSLSSTGVAGNAGGGWADVIKPPAKLRGHERMAYIRGAILDRYIPGVTLVAVEGPSYGNQGAQRQAGHHERAGLWWLLTHYLWAADVPTIVVPPASLKKYATGKGNAGKDDVLREVVRRFPWFQGDNNARRRHHPRRDGRRPHRRTDGGHARDAQGRTRRRAVARDGACAMTESKRPHGYARYKLDGCRCYICAFAVSEYERRRQKAIAAGTWQPYVDAAPVRAHLKMLSAAGIGHKTAARAAGVPTSTVQQVLYGRGADRPTPSAQLRGATAAKILALRPTLELAAPAAVIDGTGTRRRIQGMCVRGWSLTYQAGQVGRTVANYAPLVAAPRVLARTARAVADLHERIALTDPPSGYSATRTRRWASGQHWLPPLVWDEDDIDDPRAVPCVLPPVDGSDRDVDEHALTVAYLYRDHTIDSQIKRELVLRMTVAGYDRHEIAAVARTTVAYADQLIRQARRAAA